MLDREQVLERIRAQHPEHHLITHALASEAIMRALAEKFGEDADLWGITGLAHDIDYPLTHEDPSRHGILGPELVPELPEESKQAIKAHNGEHTGLMPETRLDYALRCAETVTGLVSAAALVRPDGMHGMEPKSLKKKMKDKAFAASVRRDTIRECEKLSLSLDEFLALSIAAMLPLENELGLAKKF